MSSLAIVSSLFPSKWCQSEMAGSNPKPIASVPSLSVPTGTVVSRTFIPSVTCSGSGGVFDEVGAHAACRRSRRPPATNGTGMPGAASETIVNARTSPSVATSTSRNSVPKQPGARVAPVEVPGAARRALVRDQVGRVAQHQVVDQRDLTHDRPPDVDLMPRLSARELGLGARSRRRPFRVGLTIPTSPRGPSVPAFCSGLLFRPSVPALLFRSAVPGCCSGRPGTGSAPGHRP